MSYFILLSNHVLSRFFLFFVLRHPFPLQIRRSRLILRSPRIFPQWPHHRRRHDHLHPIYLFVSSIFTISISHSQKFLLFSPSLRFLLRLPPRPPVSSAPSTPQATSLSSTLPRFLGTAVSFAFDIKNYHVSCQNELVPSSDGAAVWSTISKAGKGETNFFVLIRRRRSKWYHLVLTST